MSELACARCAREGAAGCQCGALPLPVAEAHAIVRAVGAWACLGCGKTCGAIGQPVCTLCGGALVDYTPSGALDFWGCLCGDELERLRKEHSHRYEAAVSGEVSREMRQLRAENSRLTQELAETSGRLQQLESAEHKTYMALVQTRVVLNETNSRFKQCQADLEKAQAEYGVLREELVQNNARYAEVHALYEQRSAEHNALLGQLSALRAARDLRNPMPPIDRALLEQGFQRIGRIDAVRRRSLWLREEADSITLRAGREGDDAQVTVTKDHVLYPEICDVLSCARFAAEWEDPRGLALEPLRDQYLSAIEEDLAEALAERSLLRAALLGELDHRTALRVRQRCQRRERSLLLELGYMDLGEAG